MSRETPLAPTAVKPGRHGFTFRQLCGIVWAHRMTIAVAAGVALTTTWLAGRLAPTTYEATATVLVAFQMKDPAAAEFPAHLAQAYLASQTQAIRSRRVLARAVEKLDLQAVPEFMAGYPGDGSVEAKSAWATQRLGDRVSVAPGEGRFIY